jgi:hypothetical protein
MYWLIWMHFFSYTCNHQRLHVVICLIFKIENKILHSILIHLFFQSCTKLSIMYIVFLSEIHIQYCNVQFMCNC